MSCVAAHVTVDIVVSYRLNILQRCCAFMFKSNVLTFVTSLIVDCGVDGSVTRAHNSPSSLEMSSCLCNVVDAK